MFGVDKGLGPITIAMIAEQGYDLIFANMGFISNLAVGASTLAVASTLKGEQNKAMKGLYNSFGITALCGVTEPAFYGALISRPNALMGTACGAVVGGIIAGVTGLRKYVQMGCPGLLTFIMYIDENGSMHYVIIAVVVAVATIVVSFICSRIFLMRDAKKAAK